MGNSPVSCSFLLGNRDRSYQVQIGESTAIYIRGREIKHQTNGEITESWQVSYKVDNSTCNLALSNTLLWYNTKGYTNSPPHHNKLLIEIKDDAYHVTPDRYLWVNVQSVEPDRLVCSFCKCTTITGGHYSLVPVFAPVLPEPRGYGMRGQTSIFLYGSGTRRGLVVLDRKRKGEDIYMMTVAHYYANAKNGRDVGLSVLIKRIRVSDDGHLAFDVDGPHQHPVSALFYMFDEVSRTGTWKPTYCPHCNQRQRAATFWQSESEDSDVECVRQSAGGIVNDGKFNGNYNGNLNIRNLFLRGR